jgi:hypothetical protein
LFFPSPTIEPVATVAVVSGGANFRHGASPVLPEQK